MFRQIAKRRAGLEEDRKPKVVIALGVGAPKEEEAGIGPGEETDALAGDEDRFRTDRQKKAAILADHHQKLADEFRAKAEAEGKPETAEDEFLEDPAEEAAEGPGGEAAEEHVGLTDLPEEEDLEEEVPAAKNGGLLRNTRGGLPLSKVKKGR